MYERGGKGGGAVRVADALAAPILPTLSSTTLLSHPPQQDEAVRLVIDECHEHNALMQEIIQ
jgi:hypothetical protein